MANRYVCVPALVLAVLLPSCVTVVKDEPQQPKPRQLVQAESRLIQPFAAQSVIIADEVLIEISPDLDPGVRRRFPTPRRSSTRRCRQAGPRSRQLGHARPKRFDLGAVGRGSVAFPLECDG